MSVPLSLSMSRRNTLQILAASAGGLAAPAILRAQDRPVRIGYAIARTGPWAAGAQVTQEPNYLMWAEQQNSAGGLEVQGRRRRIELIGLDDRSEIETCIRSFEKLMSSDKVDLILPPWGSSANFALAPLANRHGYPMLAPTALSRKLINMHLPYFFSLLQQPDRMMDALVDMLAAHNTKTIAILYMDDLFGLENFAALNTALKQTNIQVVERKGYPLGVKDLAPTLRVIKDLNPDAFIGITYPPDTILASKQSKEIGFNPKIFYASVGTAYQVYRDVIGASAEGVSGMGSWNSKTSVGAKTYFDAHTARFGKEPERWGSGHCRAGLEILTQAVSEAGLDRKAIRDYITRGEHPTIIGTLRFEGSENAATPGSVGQWQNGEFEVVWPKEMATAQLRTPKPAWV